MAKLEVKNLTHWYDPDAPYSKKAVDDVSFTIEKGEFIDCPYDLEEFRRRWPWLFEEV